MFATFNDSVIASPVPEAYKPHGLLLNGIKINNSACECENRTLEYHFWNP